MSPHIIRFVALNAASDDSSYVWRKDNRDSKKLEQDATKAGYGDVKKYMSELLTPARLYQECIADSGAKSKLCDRYKKRWLECKAAHNGNKIAWNEEEIRKMIKEDAFKAGYKDGYSRKKNLTYCALIHEECVDKHGAEDSFCKQYEQNWLECKMAQKGSEVAWNKSGSNLHAGNEVAWSKEEIRKMIKEDAIKAGFKDRRTRMKDPKYCAVIYKQCVAEYGAQDSTCKKYEKKWLECKAAQKA